MDKIGMAFAKAKREGANMAAFLRDMAMKLETPKRGYSFDNLKRDLKYVLEWVDNDLDAPAQAWYEWPDFARTDVASWVYGEATIYSKAADSG